MRIVCPSIMTSQLDYCNGLLYTELPFETWNVCMAAQNSLARAVCQATWSASSTKLRRSLHSVHWLPVKQRVDYKLAVIAYTGRVQPARQPLQPTCRRSSRTMNRADRCARLNGFYCAHRALNLFVSKSSF